MNRKEAAVLLPIIKAFSEGKEIEGIYKGTKSPWFKVEDMDFDSGIIFRIKPEPKYRPFANAEECWAEMQKHQPFGWLECVGCRYNIVSVSNIDVSMANVSGDILTLRFCDVMETGTFADGTTFGVNVEE